MGRKLKNTYGNFELNKVYKNKTENNEYWKQVNDACKYIKDNTYDNFERDCWNDWCEYIGDH